MKNVLENTIVDEHNMHEIFMGKPCVCKSSFISNSGCTSRESHHFVKGKTYYYEIADSGNAVVVHHSDYSIKLTNEKFQEIFTY